MSDNVDLRLVLRNSENAARDARAALEATLRFVAAFEGRISAMEGRIGGLETRITGVERSIDDIARSVHQTQQMVAPMCYPPGRDHRLVAELARAAIVRATPAATMRPRRSVIRLSI